MAISIKTQIEQLDNNYWAVQEIEKRCETLNNAPYYSLFGREDEREEKLQKLSRLKERILKMRMRLLSKIRQSTLSEITLIKQ